MTSIGAMRLRLPELQDDNMEVRDLQSKDLLEGQKDIKDLFHYEGLPYVLKIIRSELINCYYNDPLTGYFETQMNQELIVRSTSSLPFIEMLKPI